PFVLGNLAQNERALDALNRGLTERLAKTRQVASRTGEHRFEGRALNATELLVDDVVDLGFHHYRRIFELRILDQLLNELRVVLALAFLFSALLQVAFDPLAQRGKSGEPLTDLTGKGVVQLG